MRSTVRLRLTAWYASIFLLGGAVLLAISYVIVSHNTATFPVQVKQEMTRLGVQTGPQLSIFSGGVVTRVSGSAKGVVAIIGGGRGNAKIQFHPQGVGPPKSARAFVQKLTQTQAVAESTIRGKMHRQTAIDFSLALLGTTLLSLLAGWVLAGRALRPVSRITATARRVSASGDLSERIALDGPSDELRELADTFDGMLERLDRAFVSQRSFVANASHELRTPLAVIRAEVEDRLDDPSVGELELREMAAVVYDAVARAEALIAGLLTLARSQHGIRRRTSVDLAQLSRATALHLDADPGIRLDLPTEAMSYPGDQSLLERLLGNLLENALRYNRDDGSVAVGLERAGDDVRIRVENTGPVVPHEALQHLFEPFFRVEQSRSRDSGGAGLGLSIVAAVAEAHGGTATAAARKGGGLVVTVTLPFPDEPAAPVPSRPGVRRPHVEPEVAKAIR
jgi:signal transduction histidine kinase